MQSYIICDVPMQAITPLSRNIGKFRALSFPAKLCVVDAIVLLPAFFLALRLIGFARLQAWIARRTIAAPRNAACLRPQELSRLVTIASRHTIGSSTCLTRSLVLRYLMARQGLEGKLRFGVRIEGDVLDAHAWVEHGDVPLNDSLDVTGRYAVLSDPSRVNGVAFR
jgi:hypothetical protein